MEKKLYEKPKVWSAYSKPEVWLELVLETRAGSVPCDGINCDPPPCGDELG